MSNRSRKNDIVILFEKDYKISHIDTEIRHVTPADGNIFADLGFDQEEAATLLAESDRIIAEKLAIKTVGKEVILPHYCSDRRGAVLTSHPQ